MYRIRHWSIGHARYFEWIYEHFEGVLLILYPLFNLIGFNRLDPTISVVEKITKGLLFDCQMCGKCILSSTGMSCPMNCPKELRNGPCGGVRTDSTCEMKPEMLCVWVEAWRGNHSVKYHENILQHQGLVDRRLKNHSSWLLAIQQKKRTSQCQE